jgi:hypothetical protein
MANFTPIGLGYMTSSSVLGWITSMNQVVFGHSSFASLARQRQSAVGGMT